MTIKDLTGTHLKITQFVAISKYRCMDLTTANVTTTEVKKFVDEFEVNNPSSYKLKSLSDAVISQNNIIRLARKRLPIVDTLQMYMNSQTGVKKIVNYLMFSVLINLLALTGYFKKARREVIVSHPQIYDGVKVIGRPGVKIPYAKHFGLHYQIFNEKIVITMMPGLNWKVKNEDFIDKLEKNLLKIVEII